MPSRSSPTEPDSGSERTASKLGSVSDELEAAYLLTGSDRPKVARALQRLRARVGDDAAELLHAAEASGDDAVAACNAFGLFGSRRLVVVEGVERWKAADAKAVRQYLDEPAPGAVLALVGEAVKRDSPLGKAVANAGKLLIYDIPRSDLPRWVGEQFRRFGVEADAAACRRLVETVGDDLHALASEVEKLVTWARGDPIREAEIELLAAPVAELPAFALTDAWGRRDVAGVMKACERALERSGEPASRVVPRLAGVLTSHVARVRKCRTLAAEGVRPRDAASRLRLHPYAAEKAFAHAENFSPEELGNAVVRLARLDLALKGASRLGGELELELALADVTDPARAGRRPPS